MEKPEIEAFLSHFATNRKVAASTQRQAINALVFLFKHVLDKAYRRQHRPCESQETPVSMIIFRRINLQIFGQYSFYRPYR
jgi:hypothetical protein